MKKNGPVDPDIIAIHEIIKQRVTDDSRTYSNATKGKANCFFWVSHD